MVVDLAEGDGSIAQEPVADTANRVYTEDDALRNHIENVDPMVARKKGVGGCHRKDLFLQNDIQIISSTPHTQMVFCQENGADMTIKESRGMAITKMEKSHHFIRNNGGNYEQTF